MSDLPHRVEADPAGVILALEQRALRYTTPCGDGVMVWRRWGSGPPLVLAHGASGSWLHWVRNIGVLAARRTVWVPDLPGYGESDLPPREDHAALSAVIADGMRRLLGEVPADIVGFSFGGVAAAHLAVRFPALVRRLVLVDTGGLDTPRGELHLQGVRGLDAAGRRAVNRANLLQLMLHEESSVDELALYIQARNGMQARMNPVALVLPDKLLAALPRVSAPLAAIWGEHDRPHPNPPAQEAVLRRIRPDVEFRVVAGAGHWVMYERPAAFEAALLDLLGTAPTA